MPLKWICYQSKNYCQKLTVQSKKLTINVNVDMQSFGQMGRGVSIYNLRPRICLRISYIMYSILIEDSIANNSCIDFIPYTGYLEEPHGETQSYCSEQGD